MQCKITVSNKYGTKTPFKILKSVFSNINSNDENYIKVNLRDRSPIVDIDFNISSFEFFCKVYIRIQNAISNSKKDKYEISKILSTIFRDILSFKDAQIKLYESNSYNLKLSLNSVCDMELWIVFPIDIVVYKNNGNNQLFRKGNIIASGSIIFDYDNRIFIIENESYNLNIIDYISIDECISFIMDYNNGTLQNGDEFIKTIDHNTYCIKVKGRY